MSCEKDECKCSDGACQSDSHTQGNAIPEDVKKCDKCNEVVCTCDSGDSSSNLGE